MDEKFLEQASDLAQARRDDAVRLAQRQIAGTGQPDCEECGDHIPPARRVAVPGAIRCIHCQQVFERTFK